jgi:hypothetical protein
LSGGLFGVAGTCYFLGKFSIRYFMTFSERLGEEILDRIGDDISELRSSGFVSKSLSMILQNYLLERLKRKPAGQFSVESPLMACKNPHPEMNFKKADDILKNVIFEDEKKPEIYKEQAPADTRPLCRCGGRCGRQDTDYQIRECKNA